MTDELNGNLQQIITALCDYHNRCICFRGMNGQWCNKCSESYLECECTPLTPEQIVEGDINYP